MRLQEKGWGLKALEQEPPGSLRGIDSWAICLQVSSHLRPGPLPGIIGFMNGFLQGQNDIPAKLLQEGWKAATRRRPLCLPHHPTSPQMTEQVSIVVDDMRCQISKSFPALIPATRRDLHSHLTPETS